MTNLCACRNTSKQAKLIAYFRLKNAVYPKNMRQTSLLVVLTCSFYFIITVVPVFTVFLVRGQLDGAWQFWHYGMKIRSNKKIFAILLGTF